MAWDSFLRSTWWPKFRLAFFIFFAIVFYTSPDHHWTSGSMAGLALAQIYSFAGDYLEVEQAAVSEIGRGTIQHRRVHHYLVPYLWALADKLSGEQAAPAAVDRTKMHSKADKNAPPEADKNAPSTPLKTPYSSPESSGYRGWDVGSAAAAQLATELWRVARIDILRLSERQRRSEIAMVQSWIDAGWTPDVIRLSALDQMRTRSAGAEPVRCLGIFRKKLEHHYATLAARRMAG